MSLKAKWELIKYCEGKKGEKIFDYQNSPNQKFEKSGKKKSEKFTIKDHPNHHNICLKVIQIK